MGPLSSIEQNVVQYPQKFGTLSSKINPRKKTKISDLKKNLRIMDFRCISVVFAVVLCATSAFAVYPLMPSEELLSIARCVAKSQNQELCNEFLQCQIKSAKTYADAFTKCIQAYAPEGVGECTENKELYHSEEIRVK
ncbi:hypothetical protein NPIL_355821, partial [Nephila pilipes]